MRPTIPSRWRAALTAAVAALVLARPAPACDVCAVYTATEQGEARAGWRAGVFEQLSLFRSVQEDGDEIPSRGERLTSSITQVLAGYQFTPRLGLQVNLPIISRTFRRLEDGRLRSGDETGLGDLSLIGRGLVHSVVTERAVFRFSLLGGVKFPTGDSDRLGEELAAAPDDHHDASQARPQFRPLHDTGGGGGGGTAEPPPPGAPRRETAVHGHDLALGSGSYDGIVGGDLFWSWQRLFLAGGLQYAIRSEGAFGYRYADDLTWAGGPGVFVLAGHDRTLALQAVSSGETKGKDRADGKRFDDTGITAVYLGPGATFTWGTRLAADLAVDLPVVQNNTAVQIVPDVRLRGGITWRF
jgi:hypothetical protein